MTKRHSMRLFYTLALTRKDFDLEKKKLFINKSFQSLQGKHLVTTPKTEKSNRTIDLPDFLCDEMEDYFGMLYKREADRSEGRAAF